MASEASSIRLFNDSEITNFFQWTPPQQTSSINNHIQSAAIPVIRSQTPDPSTQVASASEFSEREPPRLDPTWVEYQDNAQVWIPNPSRPFSWIKGRLVGLDYHRANEEGNHLPIDAHPNEVPYALVHTEETHRGSFPPLSIPRNLIAPLQAEVPLPEPWIEFTPGLAILILNDRFEWEKGYLVALDYTKPAQIGGACPALNAHPNTIPFAFVHTEQTLQNNHHPLSISRDLIALR